jgi:WhiB family transcriptional regulator, redox-sensing transcriptional regulator
MAALEEIGIDDRAIDTDADGTAEPPSVAWKELAACKGRTGLFFPPKAERPQARGRREAQARRLCVACPVRSICQDFARTNREYGYWGGESEEDRYVAGFTVSAPIGVRLRDPRL